MDRDAVAAVATLDDDVRAALYDFVRASDGPVTREAAAVAVGVSRKLAAFHLDKLVAAGLLIARIESVGTPRVGRTPKVYEPAPGELAVRIPPREPDVLAEILVEAVCSEQPGEQAHAAALRVARRRGVETGAAEREQVRPGRLGPERALRLVGELLSRYGFEPAAEPSGLRLRNCPFHPHAATAPELVCGVNHAFVCGMLEGLAADRVVKAHLVPHPGACCVEIDQATG